MAIKNTARCIARALALSPRQHWRERESISSSSSIPLPPRLRIFKQCVVVAFFWKYRRQRFVVANRGIFSLSKWCAWRKKKKKKNSHLQPDLRSKCYYLLSPAHFSSLNCQGNDAHACIHVRPPSTKKTKRQDDDNRMRTYREIEGG